MMSVLIKGLTKEKVESCFRFAKDGWCIFDMPEIIEVPPHGRLIDADAFGISLKKMAAEKWNHKTAPVNWSYAFEEYLEMVDNAPTIIEQNFIKVPTTQAEESE